MDYAEKKKKKNLLKLHKSLEMILSKELTYKPMISEVK